METPKTLPLYRLDWGLKGKPYELRENRLVWVEEFDFSNKKYIHTENYQQITYAKYLELCRNNQIVDDYTEDGAISFVKADG